MTMVPAVERLHVFSSIPCWNHWKCNVYQVLRFVLGEHFRTVDCGKSSQGDASQWMRESHFTGAMLQTF